MTDPSHPPTADREDKPRTDPDRLPADPSAAPSEGSGISGELFEDDNGLTVERLGELAITDLTDGPPGNEIDERAAAPSDGTGISGAVGGHGPDPDEP